MDCKENSQYRWLTCRSALQQCRSRKGDGVRCRGLFPDQGRKVCYLIIMRKKRRIFLSCWSVRMMLQQTNISQRLCSVQTTKPISETLVRHPSLFAHPNIPVRVHMWFALDHSDSLLILLQKYVRVPSGTRLFFIVLRTNKWRKEQKLRMSFSQESLRLCSVVLCSLLLSTDHRESPGRLVEWLEQPN